MFIFVCRLEYGHSNIFLVKVLKILIKLLAQSRFSLTAHKHSIEVFKNTCDSSIDGFRDLHRTHSLILTLYFHMHHVKFHLMKSSKRCLDTLYFESPFEFMSLNIFNSCRNENLVSCLVSILFVFRIS